MRPPYLLRPPNQKPSFPARINWCHPLARGLKNFIALHDGGSRATRIYDSAIGKNVIVVGTNSGNPSWRANSITPGLYNNGSDASGGSIDLGSDMPNTNAAQSLALWFTPASVSNPAYSLISNI